MDIDTLVQKLQDLRQKHGNLRVGYVNTAAWDGTGEVTAVEVVDAETDFDIGGLKTGDPFVQMWQK